MYFVSFVYENKENYGVLNNDKTKIIPMNLLLGDLKKDLPDTLREFIQYYSDSLVEQLKNLLPKLDNQGITIDNVKLKAPIAYPSRNVFCIGKNYADHVNEVKSISTGDTSIPKVPIFFSKVADPAIGHEDYIIYPSGHTEELDYEVELAVVIGKDGKNISPEDAENHIFGYTIANDISARDVQAKHSQWFKGKNMDTFLPMGPYLVHKSEIGFPVKLNIQSRVNGELRQNSNTEELIFNIPYIISSLSESFTLRAGDIVLTGTPAGVGAGFTPPRYLKPGDVVECSIEKIGTLRNTVK
ncbi:MAG: fumarylacetoacetate hydrolase family protein [Tissierellaceae bacterium]|nr:fumarylacetoacetate hydrolase family protein [Tissierellaceae bacterium]